MSITLTTMGYEISGIFVILAALAYAALAHKMDLAENMSSSLIEEQDSLEFKADFFPMTVLKLTHTDIDAIKSQIYTTTIAAPNYFKNAPIVIDINDMNSGASSIDLEAICELLRDYNMIPVGIRCTHQMIHDIAIPERLAIMKTPKSAEKEAEPSLTTGNVSSEKAPEPEPPKKEAINTKLLTMPVRSGTQVYARDADLVITAAVNPGGECFADGNIHVYGPLRGKVLAGANGNEKARIFCTSLEAELIAIAGHYLTNDKISVPKSKKPMIQIYLKDDKLQIEPI